MKTFRNSKTAGFLMGFALCAMPMAAQEDGQGGEEAPAVSAPAYEAETEQRPAEGPQYSVTADALAGMSLVGVTVDPADEASVWLWGLSADLLHRVDAQGWGLVLNHTVDLSSGATGYSPVALAMNIWEAYGRLDVGDWGQLFIGQKRLPFGIGTTFAPGDALNPRSGFWDQKTGYKGLGFTASIGSDVGLRAAVDLDENFAMLQKIASIRGSVPAAAQEAAIQAAFDAADVDSAADPELIAFALAGEWQSENLQLALTWVYGYDRHNLPALGASIDIEGLVLQAEAALEFETDGDPGFFFTGGARWSWVTDDTDLTLSLDYDYNGARGLLEETHYLLPTLSFTVTDVLNVYARGLIGIDSSSALLSTGLVFYPVENFDLELTGVFGLGEEDGEFADLPLPMTLPGGDKARTQIGLAARMHF